MGRPADERPELDGWRRIPTPTLSLVAATTFTLAVVFVMVVNPTLFNHGAR